MQTPATDASSPAVTPAAGASATADDPVAIAIRDRLDKATTAAERDGSATLTAFYRARNGAPLWVSGSGLSARGQAAVAFIRSADDWGLQASSFVLPGEGDSPAEAELKLSHAVLKYARQAQAGRVDPAKLSRFLDLHPVVPDPGAVLSAMAAAEHPEAQLRDYHPHHVQFERLRVALGKARGPATVPEMSEPEPVKVPERGPVLKLGMTHADVAILRLRLNMPGEADHETQFDAALKEAVKVFQRAKDLDPTGSLNGRTRSALNGRTEPKASPPRQSVERILINMERWRWMPRELGDFYVWDNVPEYQTRVMRRGEMVHTEKIIVGKTDTPTPTFSANMQFVVFHPEWGVPDSIKVKEILPYLKRTEPGFFGIGGTEADTRILKRHNLRVSYNGQPVDAAKIDWNSVDVRRFQFTQPPGGQNVLGVVKFRFPNRHDVYMHDTPQRDLFANSRRAFSHGCMRVQNPQRLAEVLLGEDQGMSGARVADLIANGNNTEIALRHPIPVHVTYFTAMVDDGGTLQSFADLYGHDQRLSLALSGKQIEFTDPPDGGSNQTIAEDDSPRSGTRADPRGANHPRKRGAPPPSNGGGLPGFLAGLFGN